LIRRLRIFDPIRVERKDLVKSLGTKALVLLFVALVVRCAFDGPGAQASAASPSQGDSVLCGSLNAAAMEISLPIQPALQASSGKAVGPLAAVHLSWLLAQSIDHPPEKPA